MFYFSHSHKMSKRKKNKQPTKAMGDWAELPKELLQLISNRLNSQLYLIRFRSVCSTWRSSIVNHYLATKLNTPTFSVCKNNIFLIKPPGHQPWFFRTGQYSRTSKLPSHFPRKLDFSQIPVLDLGVETFDFIDQLFHIPVFTLFHAKVVSTKWQGKESPPPIILAYNLDGQCAMHRCDNDHWTMIIDRFVPMVGTSDICVFKGRPYVVENTGRTLMIGLDSSVHLVAEPEPEPVFGEGTKLLVECEGELLMVSVPEFYRDKDGFVRTMRFKFFKLEEEEKRWVEVTSIGDNVLFLMNDYAFSVSTSDLGVDKGNCVIYTRRYEDFSDPKFRDCEMIIYQLDHGRISPLYECPGFFNLFRPPTGWVVFMSRNPIEEEDGLYSTQATECDVPAMRPMRKKRMPAKYNYHLVYK